MSESSINLNAECTTLVDVLRWRALHQPDRRAYTFLVDGETEEVHLAYGELDCRARAIGSLLQDLGASGERVLLLYPPGLEYIAAFFGCLYAGAVAVPSYPPRLNRPDSRLRAILADSRSTVALTTSEILANLESRFIHTPELRSLHWAGTDSLTDDLAEAWCDPVLDSAALAFLQYTSGSTAMPKGVMVSHGNIMYNERMIQQVFGQTEESIVVGWLPIYHDMGLIGNVLQPLFAGSQCVLMSPLDFLQNPVRWLQMISCYRGCTSGGPNFAYDLCVHKVTPEQREALDLSSWTVAFNGAEPVRHQTIQRFSEAFEPCGFRGEAFHPCYGLAEATLLVSGGTKSEPPVFYIARGKALEQDRAVSAPTHAKDARVLVGCGRTALDQKIVIVNPETSIPSPPNHVGEIWVAGCNVALGYWGRPSETEYTFQAYLADTGEGPFLRTGDLGFLENGELFITGRLKDLIIIRGCNYYPQDIELTVEQSHPALRPGCSAAFSVDVAGVERLVIAQEVKRTHRKANVDEIAPIVCQAIAEEHSLEVYAVVLLKPMSIPKTSSGKIQRCACRKAFLCGTLNGIGEWRRTIQDPESYNAKCNSRVGLSEQALSVETIQAWLISHLSKHLGSEPQSVDVWAPFTSFGLDSMQAVSLSGELSDWLGRRLSPTLAWEYPSIEALSRYLAGESPTSMFVGQADSAPRFSNEPIAIIGIGCRFPGADSPMAFWQLLRDGKDAITEISPERWNISTIYDQNPVVGKAEAYRAGFLEQIDRFDSVFFGISPREATYMDPQQRLLLEVAWEALEDAGQPPSDLAGSRTGVFVGISSSDYSLLQFSDPGFLDVYAGTGNAHSIAANRLSYQLDFRGPSLAVDTACSSSLVAVYLACQSLCSGECGLALAGGVNLMLAPHLSIILSKAHMTTADGRCKAFDASADGYVRGEGVAVVVLKPLSKALSDNDPIYAVIRGGAIGHDGQTNGLMAPNPQAQETVLREAYQRSGISPGQVQYVEAHGTGTFLGDPIEAKALGSVLSVDRSGGQPCIIGSVKSNIGHLEAAAGIAGLIKTALSLKHRAIPPSLHFAQPNPHIPFEELQLCVQRTLGSWPDETRPLLAGVSSFGFGGTNAHIIVEQAPKPPSITAHCETSFPDLAYLLPMSAHSEEALYSLVQSYRDFLTDGALESGISSRDICYTASTRRSHHDYRLALVGHSQKELGERLEAFLQGETDRGVSSGRRIATQRKKIAFIFPGMGSQWVGMGQELCEQELVFRQVLEQCDLLIQRHTNWSLLEQIAADEVHSRLDEIDVAQPVLFAIQVGLAALWRSWDVEPDAVVGHSLGEVAAAHVAGALSLEDAVRIVCLRSQLLKRVSGQGAMALVGLSAEQSQAALVGHEDRVSVAVSNGPASTVLSGEPAALAEIMGRLQCQDVFCRWVQIDVAAHSPQTDPLRSELVESLKGLHSHAALVPVYSTVTGEIREGEAFDAHYWGQNLRQPVLFSMAVQALLGDGYDIFLEISSHPILLRAVEQAFCGKESITLSSLRRGEEERATMLESLGALYAQGCPLNWDALYPSGRCVGLPSYPWRRERFWLETKDVGSNLYWDQPWGGQKETQPHPLLGRYSKLTHPLDAHVWETRLDKRVLPYLDDHRVQGTTVLPGTAYVEMALAAATGILGEREFALAEIEFQKALFLFEDTPYVLQMILAPIADGQMTCHISGRQLRADQASDAWSLHVSGRICPNRTTPRDLERQVLDEIRSRCPKEVRGKDFYRRWAQVGNQWGASFQGIQRLWLGDGEALGEVWVPETLKSQVEDYQFHPAVFDACGHVLAAIGAGGNGGKKTLFVLDRIDQVHVYAHPTLRMWSHARIRLDAEQRKNALMGDIRVFDESGQVVLDCVGVSLRYLDYEVRRIDSEDPTNWLYKLKWQPAARLADQPALSHRPFSSGNWLIFADEGGVGQALADLLIAQGERCILISRGEVFECVGHGRFRINPRRAEDMERLLHAALETDHPECRGIVHLWGLEGDSGEITVSSLEAAQVMGCHSILHLVQKLVQLTWHETPRLWLITKNAQPVVSEPSELTVAQSPIWGFGRTIAVEHADLWGGLVDLDADASLRESASLLLAEVWNSDGEDQIAFRQGQRYAARLVRVPQAVEIAPSIQWRLDGSYLITGGLGDLGLLVGRWMVEQGARRLILLGRSKLPPRSSWAQVENESRLGRKIAAIRELEALGASVHLVSADVADEAQLAGFLEGFRREGWPPIRGVVHAAGSVSLQTLLELDVAMLDEVMGPKVSGAWLLHRLLESDDLDFFVFFSSATTLLGSPRLAHYAAANAFMDALAQYRRARGQPALSVDWGFWSEAGLAARYLEAGHVLLRGVDPFNPEQGIKVLEQLLRRGAIQTGVLRINWGQWFQSYPDFVQSPLFSSLRREEADTSSRPGKDGESVRDVLFAQPEERSVLLKSYLSEQLARVLGIASSRVDVRRSFNDLGVDSLMALQLKKRIEHDLDVIIPVASFFEGMSIDRLVGQVLEEFELIIESGDFEQWDESAVADGIDSSKAQELLSSLEQLSDTEVDSLLKVVLAEERQYGDYFSG
jgi:acyl transferase domain-containing protein/acyl-CoA synthetase (AMP-forming)/AMP-acid ligase II/acyl carrier protein